MVTDAIVIGGGPAGLAAAIALRSRGFSVTLSDARRPPIDKACGEGFLPCAFDALAALGVDAHALPGLPLRGVRFTGEGVSVVARFLHGEGRGVRRIELHRALLERAESSGVRLQWGHTVSDFSGIRARWIIGADGIQSRVRQWAQLGRTIRDSRRYGFQRHFHVAPWTSEIEVHWAARGQVYVTPVSPNEVGLALLTRDRNFRLEEALASLPDLRAKLAGASCTAERGAVTATRSLRHVARGNVVLIGDASGSVDAITGEGLSLGFRQASLLANSLFSDDVTAYEYGHRTLARRPRLMGDLMLTLDRSRWLRVRALRALAARPALFAGLLAMHTGESRLPAFLNNCARLGLGMLIQPRPGAHSV